jgi:hypothetical protein
MSQLSLVSPNPDGSKLYDDSTFDEDEDALSVFPEEHFALSIALSSRIKSASLGIK